MEAPRQAVVWHRYGIGPVMARMLSCIVFAGFLLLWGTLSDAGSLERLNPKRVLLLNSYHKGYLWTDDLTRGIEDTFAGHDIELYVEYMDTKRQFGWLYRTYLYRLLSLKHIKHQYDAVITADEDAFAFFREFKDRIAKDSPHVFCGVSSLVPEKYRRIPGATGVSARADLAANIALIQRLHPKARTVLVVTDNTTAGRVVQSQVAGIQKQSPNGVTVELVFDVTMEELGEQLAALDPSVVVLYTFFFRDNRHRFFEYDRAADFVTSKARVPVYCAWHFACGAGGIGGYMVDAYRQGTSAGGKVLEILNGRPVEDIPVQWHPPIVLRFDYNRLRAHKISPARLPEGAQIINQPQSFYYRYRVLIWNLLVVFTVLVFALAGTVYSLVRLRRSERTMEKSLVRYKSLFEKTNDAIFILEGSTGRCLDANPAARDITGRSLEELRQLTVRDISPDSEKRWLDSGRPVSRAVDLGRVTYLAKDGTQRVARADSVQISDNMVMAITRDITQDLEIEQQLRQAQKMEAIGTLAGGIAHDFNNILSGIFSFCQLAQMNLEHDPKKSHDQIAQVIKGARRASELVQQILTFSRRTEPLNSYFELALIVKEAVKFLRSSIPASIEIKEHVDCKAVIEADPIQVHQVVMNLGTNAYHAMGESEGCLTICLGDEQVSSFHIPPGYPDAQPGAYARLVVKDTGHGMDDRTMERIFDPYFTTKQQGKGTGMGLSVVDGILRQHKGFVRVSSAPGKGARFEVFWPVTDHELPEFKGFQEIEDCPDQQGNILVVDDESGILNAMKALLGRRGYTVTTKNSPVAALALFEKDPDAFDLVITDMTMPKMSGARLVEKMFALRPNLAVILCTGYHESMSEPEALALGVAKYLPKPIMTHDLYKAVSDLIHPS